MQACLIYKPAKLCFPASIILEAGIFILHFIWLFRTRKLRKRAKLEGREFDDIPEARQWQWKPTDKTGPNMSALSDVETSMASIDQVIDKSKQSDSERRGSLLKVGD